MPKLIGISGGSGSGKTTLANHLGRLLQCPVLNMDDFYHPLAMQELDENGKPNFDLPTALDLDKFEQSLFLLKQGKNITIEQYNFNNPNKKQTNYAINASFPYVITEGIFLFEKATTLDLLHYSIFVDAPLEIMFQRRLLRDVRDRSIKPEMVKYQWENHFVPAYEKYVLPKKTQVDLIVNGNNQLELDKIISQLPK